MQEGRTMKGESVALDSATLEERARGGGASLSGVALVTLTMTLLLQVARVFLPMVFDLGERSGTASSAIKAGALALIVFLAPAIAPLVRRSLGARTSLVATLATLAGLRMVIQLIHPIPLWLSTTAMVVALLGLALLLVAMKGGDGAAGGRVFVLGSLTALAIDTGLRSAYWTWDYAWRSGPVPFLLAMILGAILVLALARQAGALSAQGGVGSARTAALVGPFLFLHMLFLQNAAFLSSSGHVSLPIAVGVVLLGDAIGLVAAVWIWGREVSASTRLVAAAAIVVLAYLFRQVDGGALIPVVLAGHALAAAFLAMALARPVGPTLETTWRTSTAVAVGMLAFTLFLVLYQIGYRVALPVPNTVLAPAAAFLLALGGLRAPAASTGRVRLRPHLLAGVPLILLLVPAGMLLTEASEIRETGRGSIRLMTYNVHLGINSDGQLDLEGVARVIERGHPDVVALQEVVRGWPGAGGIDLAQWLSHRLRMPYAYAPAADDQFGNVIMSRLPIRASQGVFLPKPTAAMRRSYLRTVIDIGEGHTLTVVDAHLEGGEPTQRAQSESLLNGLAGVPNIVLAGDLNMQPDSPNRSLYDAGGLASVQDLAGQGDLSTAAKPKFPGDRVDWIFGTGDLSFTSFKIGQQTTSDHLPLSVALRVP